jgi:hypothetical protein
VDLARRGAVRRTGRASPALAARAHSCPTLTLSGARIRRRSHR